MPQAEIAGQFTKASWEVTAPANIGHDIARAIRTAKTGRPGPVHLAVPGELFEQSVDHPARCSPHTDDFAPLTGLLDVATANAVLASLFEAEHPVILAGPSMTRGDGPVRLRELSEQLNVPVVAMESPRGLKDPSLGRFREVLAKADLVLLLARSLNFTVRFGESPAFREDCRFLMIDPEARIIEQANRNLQDESRLILTDLADPLPAVERLLQLGSDRRTGTPSRADVRDGQECPSYGDGAWKREFDDAIADGLAGMRSQGFDKSLGSERDDGPIHPALLCCAIQEFLTDDDIAIADGGEFGQWAQACLFTGRRVINGPSGSIGGGLSFAFAARFADPAAKIVACVGDGTFGFHAMEFDTAVRHNLPAVIVVGNDACWNAERQIQIRDYGDDRQIGCDLRPSRYDEVARSLGGHGEFVTRFDELQPALRRAFESGKPACVNVLIEGAAAPE